MKTFDSIKARLEEKGIVFEVVTFTDIAVSARTTDTSTDHNYNPANSIKTLIISTKDGFTGVVLKGSDRVDQPKLKSIVGKWKVVDSDTLQNQLGYIPGTICPLDLDLPLLIDEAVSKLSMWSMGAGANDKGFNVEMVTALKNLNNHTVVDIRKVEEILTSV